MTPNEIAVKTANELMICPSFVTINKNRIFELVEKIKQTKPNNNQWPLPDINLLKDQKLADTQIILYELIASSVNYKYWYGKSDIRPNQSNASKMYKILDDSFKETYIYDAVTDAYCDFLIYQFKCLLTAERFPMISERANHLKELQGYETGAYFARELVKKIEEKPDLDHWMNLLIMSFTGFAQDIFLKRANLFFMQLYRRKGWFKEEINKLIIPADYHIPNVLRCLECINYDPKTSNDIDECKLIPEGSQLESEIRAASIVTAEIMKEKGVSPVQLDDFLWANKKLPLTPFHLTITTNY